MAQGRRTKVLQSSVSSHRGQGAAGDPAATTERIPTTPQEAIAWYGDLAILLKARGRYDGAQRAMTKVLELRGWLGDGAETDTEELHEGKPIDPEVRKAVIVKAARAFGMLFPEEMGAGKLAKPSSKRPREEVSQNGKGRNQEAVAQERRRRQEGLLKPDPDGRPGPGDTFPKPPRPGRHSTTTTSKAH